MIVVRPGTMTPDAFREHVATTAHILGVKSGEEFDKIYDAIKSAARGDAHAAATVEDLARPGEGKRA